MPELARDGFLSSFRVPLSSFPLPFLFLPSLLSDILLSFGCPHGP